MKVWFQDEARVGQRGTVTRIWARKGIRPRIIRQQQYECVYMFGAVCPETGKSVGLVLPAVNTEAMQIHIDVIAKELEEGEHAVIVLDRATWHTTKKLQIPNNMSLISLPPVSPELNPIEQVWQYLRDKYLSNRCFKDYADIVEACCNSWNELSEKIEVLKKLCKRGWAILCH